MKKIIVMLMAIMCFFAATANAAVFDVKYKVTQYNALQFEVEMTKLTTYSVKLDGKQLILTIDAPIMKGRTFHDSVVINNFPLVNRMFPSSTATKTTVRVPLNSPITESDYKIYIAKKNSMVKAKYDRIILEISAPKKNPPPAPARVLSKENLEYFLAQPNWYDEYGQLAFTFDLNNSTFTEKGKIYKAHIENREFPIKMSDGSIVQGNRYFLVLNDNGKLTEREISKVLGAAGRTMFLILSNYPTALQRTKTIPYTDSIGGVYLGMPRRMVEQLYGAPDSSDVNNNGSGRVKYNKDNWEIRYYGNRVYEITIHKGGTRRFDRTGLGCDSSLDSFARAYNINGPIDIMNLNSGLVYSGSKISKDNERMYREYLWFIDNGDIKLTYDDLWT